MRASFILLLLIGVAVPGCIGGDNSNDVGSPTIARSVVWEGPLDANVTTPGHVEFASDDARRADVVAPGAPQYAVFDQVMRNFVEHKGLQAAGVAVLRNGGLRYENGYGWMDEARTVPAAHDAMFRLASVTKPLTAALIQQMTAEGLVGLDRPMFCIAPEPREGCFLDLPVHPKRPILDERVADITVEDVIRHRTGWDRLSCSAPLVGNNPISIAEEFEIPSPPPAWRLAQWSLGEPLTFDPGAEAPEGVDGYCNMGYVMLALAAEAEFGATTQEVKEAYLYRPLEVSGHIEQGRTFPEDRNPREPHYPCESMRENLWEPGTEVCAPDGAIHMESYIGSGGLTATAAAIGAIYHEYWNDGTLRDDVTLGQQCHSGGLPSTATTVCRYTQTNPADVQGMVEVVVLASGLIGHDTPFEDDDLTYQFERLHADLLSAFVVAEQEVDPPL